MGLDQYMYVAAKAGSDSEHREIGYRRKHPNLHGWMERLWMEKDPGAHLQTSFNGVEVELTWAGSGKVGTGHHFWWNLPATTGFFFGEGSDEFYKQGTTWSSSKTPRQKCLWA
jgi:hypothetical protein